MANLFEIGEVVKVDVYVVSSSPFRNRFLANDDIQIADLVESIRRDGQLTPAVGYEHSPGKITLIGGERRKQVCARLGIPLVVMVIRQPSKKEEAALCYEDNVSLHLSTMDKAVKMQSMLEAGWKQEDVAKKFVNAATGKHITREYVSMCCNLLKLVPEAQTLIHRGVKGCGIKWGIEVGKLKGYEQQQEVAKCAKEGAPEIYDSVMAQLTEAKIQTPSQVDGDVADARGEEGEEGSGGSKTPAEPKEKRVGQRTLTEVKDCLTACLESDKVGEDERKVCSVFMEFIVNKNRTMPEVTKALSDEKSMAKTVRALEKFFAENEKHEQDAKDQKAAKAKADKDATAKARQEMALKAIDVLVAAGWTPMKGNDGRWKDPTNAKSPYIPTMEAYAVQLTRQTT